VLFSQGALHIEQLQALEGIAALFKALNHLTNQTTLDAIRLQVKFANKPCTRRDDQSTDPPTMQSLTAQHAVVAVALHIDLFQAFHTVMRGATCFTQSGELKGSL
jgi:hypothetical protein